MCPYIRISYYIEEQESSKWKFIGSEMIVYVQTWSITSRTRNVTRLSICCIYHDTNTSDLEDSFRNTWLSIYRELVLPSKNFSNICIFFSIHLSSLLFILSLKIIELEEYKNHASTYVSWRKVITYYVSLIHKVHIKYC